MQKSDIQIGSVYTSKISGVLAPVKILEINEYVMGGRTVTRYSAINLKTSRKLYIKSAAKLRREISSTLEQRLAVDSGINAS